MSLPVAEADILCLDRVQVWPEPRLTQKHYLQASEADCKSLARYILSQWPLRELTTSKELPNLSLVDVKGALVSVRPEWERLVDNYQLSEHLADVQKLLDSCRVPVQTEKRNEEDERRDWYPMRKPSGIRPCIADLSNQPLKERPADEDIHPGQIIPRAQWAIKIRDIISTNPTISFGPTSNGLSPHAEPLSRCLDPNSELAEIISHFSKSRGPVRSAYGQDLNRSLFALQQCKDKSKDNSLNTLQVDTRLLDEAIFFSRKDIQAKFESIRASMVAGHKWLEIGGLLPILTPMTLLETLRNCAQAKRGGAIQAKILRYAESIVQLQQLLRIQDAHRQDNKIQLTNEWDDVAHTGWKTEEHIDWLLLEIDFNLIIREDQVQVAQAMIASPSTISNFVLQMNMGQGKSSVIIPMVATALAKDENLVRVVVPRSLLLQAAQLLSSRLGGLINRKIKHIPFSRKSRTDIESIKAYHKLHRDIYKGGGVLLALPEHLLSFQLSGLQELSNG